MNCTECKGLLVEYTENLLEVSQKRSIADHLEECSVCREEAEIIRTLQTRLIEDSQVAGQTYPEDEVMNRDNTMTIHVAVNCFFTDTKGHFKEEW